MEQLIQDVEETIKEGVEIIRSNINELAEKYAETYVSSYLGLSDGDSAKQRTKDQYIAHFIELIFIKI